MGNLQEEDCSLNGNLKGKYQKIVLPWLITSPFQITEEENQV